MPWHPTVLSLHPQQPQGPPVPKGGTQSVPQSALQVPGLTDSAKMRNVRAGLEHTSQTPVPITDPPARGMMLMAGNVLGECGFASSALPLGDAEDWLPLHVPSGMSPSPGVLPTPRGGIFCLPLLLVCDELHLSQMFRGQENLFEVKSQ